MTYDVENVGGDHRFVWYQNRRGLDVRAAIGVVFSHHDKLDVSSDFVTS